MSDSTSKTFVYVDKLSGRVLMVKGSRGPDFRLQGKSFITHEIVSDLRFPRIQDFSYTYSPVEGLSQAGPPEALEEQRLLVQRRKIEVLILLLANLGLIRRDLRETFSSRNLAAAPISRENFFMYWQFMQSERGILVRKLKRFFAEFQASLEEAADLSAVDAAYHRLTVSRSIGFFTATRSDRVIHELARN